MPNTIAKWRQQRRTSDPPKPKTRLCIDVNQLVVLPGIEGVLDVRGNDRDIEVSHIGAAAACLEMQTARQRQPG
jgi:hypothetical protein